MLFSERLSRKSVGKEQCVQNWYDVADANTQNDVGCCETLLKDGFQS